ncbi:MAG TPA: G/U mismatch-specific DNA glycosylase [Syntrophomonadaceae bacterium]|nr:G/U mismatch-specific DNA glycosylase [Syntrophomonadaceae bacterium]HQD91158.1 G/U mismatch-specific DNA glycosylase [Syntrophomonadaceae bacterium]
MRRLVPDHLRSGLKIVFVGFNPSLRSAEVGHHYANPSNRFWTILFKAGLTPRKYRPEEDHLLLEMGYGFTNIVERPTRTAAEITREEYQRGRQELRAKIQYYQPKTVCFVGKGVYQEYSGQHQIPWGLQTHSIIEGTLDFVAPSSSGLVRMTLDEVVDIYRGLVRS